MKFLKSRKRSSLAVAVVALACVVPSAAQATTPHWALEAQTNTSAGPGSTLNYAIHIANLGTEETLPGSCPGAECQTLTVHLPEGLTALGTVPLIAEGWQCTVLEPQEVLCENEQPVQPIPSTQNILPKIQVQAHVENSAAGSLVAHMAVSGGGAGTASIAASVLIDGAPTGFGIEKFDSFAEDGVGQALSAAGGRPAGLVTQIDYDRLHDPLETDFWPAAPMRDTVVELPPGLIGDPNSASQCTAAELSRSNQQTPLPLCAPASQVGLVTVLFAYGSFNTYKRLTVPLYNMVPPPGVPARFGFNVSGTLVVLDAEVRSGSDYGINVSSRQVSEGLATIGTHIEFWGVPSAAAHDPFRDCSGEVAVFAHGPSCASESEEFAFFRNPTDCSHEAGGLATTVRADSWFEPGVWKEASSISHQAPGYPNPPSERGAPVGPTDCAAVPFEPTITVRPTTDQADSPTGLNVDLAMPQSCFDAGETESICDADVKDTRVTQPVGTRINPATADGLTGCSEAQIGFIGGGFPMPNPTHFTADPPTCPDSSKIGTVEIESPLLPDKLEGSIYQAKQDENPFGSTLAFYAVASADGVMIKLPAEVLSDPRTGQVTTVFRDSPQLPFEHYKLHFFGGSRAPLITPPTCGTKTTHSTLTGWANPGSPVHLEDSFQITSGAGGSPCPASESGRPFAPSFEAGTTSPVAGAFSPFVLKVGRADGMQELQTITTTMPEGLLGKLAGVSYCPESAIAAASSARGLAERAGPSCPAASQIGVAQATAGAGPTPFDNPGKVYLAGPYKGAPLSLVIVTPAVAGPLDLGTVVVRSALQVDPQTTQIHVVSDPIPASITEGGDGFPLDVRQVIVQIDRPDFTLNPTSCEPSAVTGTIGAVQGASANVSDRFQVGGCEGLAFKPRLSLRLKGRTRRAGHPALRATLTMPGANQANIARTTVSLPRTEFLAQGHLGDVCTRVQYAEGGGGGGGCPRRSVYGHARAWSPLLAAPLEGNVYLRSNGGERKLPDLVASLNGQIHLDLLGYVSSNPKTHGLRTSFATVPDAPVSKFVLTMPAGRHSLLENTTNICHATNRAIVQMDGQNGKISDSRPRLKVAGCRSHKKHHRRHKSKG